MAAERRPNVLWIGTDEHLLSTIGAYGSQFCQTPNLDRLAAQGLVFSNAFCPMAVCAPSRAAMMTGRMPSEGGIITNNPMAFTMTDYEIGRHKPLENWATATRDAGYRNVYIGKWRVTSDHGDRPSQWGFEGLDWPGFGWGGFGRVLDHPDYYAYREGLSLPAQPSFDSLLGHEHPLEHPVKADPGILARRLLGPEEGSPESYLAHLATGNLRDLGGEYQRTGQPFVVRVEFWGPHFPCIVPSPYFERYDPEQIPLPPNFGVLGERKPEIQKNLAGAWGIGTLSESLQRQYIAAYMAGVTNIDAQVGKMLTALDELGLANDTMVIFTSDHGDMLGAHGLHDKGPFMYDEIYRVPLIVRWPGTVAPGRNEGLVYNMDLATTMWELVDKPAPQGISARSLLPVLRGDQQDLGREAIICEFHRQFDFYSQVMAHTAQDVFIYNFAGIDEYYDLKTDPWQLKNRIGDPAVRQRIHALRQRVYDWMREAHSPMTEGFERSLVKDHWQMAEE